MLRQVDRFFSSIVLSIILLALSHSANRSFAQSRPPVAINPPAAGDQPGNIALAYCSQTGGSKSYESIQNIIVAENPNNSLTIQVVVWISNPSNCSPGKPCPAYDNSPEHVNVWIDWNGDEDWDDPGEKVAEWDLSVKNLSGSSYFGAMFSPPKNVPIPNIQGKRPTMLRANLGWGFDPNNPCTPRSWRWGDVEDKEILTGVVRVERISTIGSVQLQDVINPVWLGNYDAEGNLRKEEFNDPIAAGAMSILPNNPGNFLLDINLRSFPSDAEMNNPKTKFTYAFEGTSLKSSGTFNGWQSSIGPILLPQKIGKYTLLLNFETFDEQNISRGKQPPIRLTVYVTHRRSILPNPKLIWIQKAVEWVQGLSVFDTEKIALQLMNNIYANADWKYRNQRVSWHLLMNRFAGDLKFDRGSCRSMADIWDNLMKVLGIPGVSIAEEKGQFGKGFMNQSGLAAFDGTIGYARDSFFLDSGDRWVWDVHYFGFFKNAFYDVTINMKRELNERARLIAYERTGKKENGFVNILPAQDFEWTKGPTDCAKLIATLDHSGTDVGAWNQALYDQTSCPPGLENAVFHVHSIALDSLFTGNYTEEAVDSDNDGTMNFLTSTVQIFNPDTARYILVGKLMKGDSVITSREEANAIFSPVHAIPRQSDSTEIRLIFSGEDIFASKADGPYTIRLAIKDTVGALVDTLAIVTRPYDHRQFGELVSRITGASDSGVDSNNDGLFDWLNVLAGLQINRSMTYQMNASLKSGEVIIASATQTVAGAPGASDVSLNFPGTQIANAGIDGPYLLEIVVTDENFQQLDRIEQETAAYQVSDFQKPLVRFAGSFSDRGVDSDGNSLYDSLAIDMEIQADSAGTFMVIAWLQNEQGEDAATASTFVTVANGSQTRSIAFPGTAIYSQQQDGAYVLKQIALFTADNRLLAAKRDAHTTQVYAFSAFESPPAALITATGAISDASVDTDNDGLFDALALSIEVSAADSGFAWAIGRLVDDLGDEIVASAEPTWVQAGQTQHLQLRFDGRFIYGSQVDGPYSILNLTVYHSIDPSQTVLFSQPYTTAFYSYSSFEPAAVISGTVTDSIGTPIPDALLYIPGGDFDYANAVGKFNLVAFRDSTYEVKIIGPDSSLAVWSIFVNGEFIGRGDSVRTPVKIGKVTEINYRSPLITAAPVQVTLPEWISPNGSEVAYPVTLGRVDGKEIYSADIVVAFDPKILRVISATTAGSIAESWGQPTFNASIEGQFRIAMAGASALADSGALVFVNFEVLGAQGDSTHVRATNFTFNEGSPPVVIENGLFRVGTPTSVEEGGDLAPETFALFQNYPNPFNPRTVIRFQLPVSSHVKLSIYNLQGQLVRTVVSGEMPAGQHSAIWDATDGSGVRVASGIYTYRLQAGSFQQVRKMLLLR